MLVLFLKEKERSCRPIAGRFLFYLFDIHSQEADNCTEQSNTFNEGGQYDSGTANITSRFRLTGDAFSGFASDLSDADTGTNGYQASSDSCAQWAVGGDF
jgi:hypothetical protein